MPAVRRRRRAVVAGCVAVAAAVGAAALAGAFGGDDEPAGEVRLEPLGAPVPDAFGPDLDLDRLGQAIAIALPQLPVHERGIASLLSGRRAPGDTPGLFGGTRDEAVCDVAALAAFLDDPANRDKAEEWSRVLGIDAAAIDGYLDGLTAVRVRTDTRVTNHGFRDGRATPVQSILQAGTAVLVDASGAPRVKCGCGNPLLEPAPAGGTAGDAVLDPEALASNIDDAWPGFDPSAVVTVEPAAEQDELVLLDLGDGELFSREVGSNGEADADVRDLAEKCRELDDSPSCATEAEEDEPADGGSFCEEPLQGVFRRLYSTTLPEDPGEELGREDRTEVNVLGPQFIDAVEADPPPAATTDDVAVVTAWIEDVLAGAETTFPSAVEQAFDRLSDVAAEGC